MRLLIVEIVTRWPHWLLPYLSKRHKNRKDIKCRGGDDREDDKRQVAKRRNKNEEVSREHKETIVGTQESSPQKHLCFLSSHLNANANLCLCVQKKQNWNQRVWWTTVTF